MMAMLLLHHVVTAAVLTGTCHRRLSEQFTIPVALLQGAGTDPRGYIVASQMNAIQILLRWHKIVLPFRSMMTKDKLQFL